MTSLFGLGTSNIHQTNSIEWVSTTAKNSLSLLRILCLKFRAMLEIEILQPMHIFYVYKPHFTAITRYKVDWYTIYWRSDWEMNITPTSTSSRKLIEPLNLCWYFARHRSGKVDETFEINGVIKNFKCFIFYDQSKR